MRKNQLLYSALPIALLSGIATNVFAGENCLLNSPNVQNCKGAIKIVEDVVINTTGPNQMHSQMNGAQINGANSYSSSSYTYSSSSNGQYVNEAQIAKPIYSEYENEFSNAVPVQYMAPVNMPPVNMAPVNAPKAAPQAKGCKLVQQGPCNGNWVVSGSNYYNGANIVPPANVYSAPQNVYVSPPQIYTQSTTIYAMPAQVYMYPVQQMPQVINNIPTSFFTGGMHYGVGYPTMTGYNSGGGMYMAGGTRFSGVANRITTPLIPPHGKPPKQPPPPPPSGCGGGC